MDCESNSGFVDSMLPSAKEDSEVFTEDVIVTEEKVASLEDQEDDNDTDMPEEDIETCATATVCEITLYAPSESDNDASEQEFDICLAENEISDVSAGLVVDIINDIVEAATNLSGCDLSHETNFEIKGVSCSDKEEETSQDGEVNHIEIPFSEHSDEYESLSSGIEHEASYPDKEPVEEDENHESAETVTKKIKSDEFPSGNVELGEESSSDEETVEADERSSDIDIVEKHVSRDSVSVQSVTEPSTEKLER